MDSNSGFHIITSLIPGIFLYFTSYSSLFIPTENFQERLIVSLTSLLCVLILWVQSSVSSNVGSSVVKIIDIWYTVLLIFCSFTVIIIVFFNFLKTGFSISRNKVFQKLEDKEAELVKENEIIYKIWKINKLLRFISLLMFVIFMFILVLIVNI